MIPVETEATDFTYELPGRPGEGDLACVRDLKKRLVTSFWAPEEEDLPLSEDRAIYVQVYDVERLIWLGLADDNGDVQDIDKRPRRAFAHDGGQQTNMSLAAGVGTWIEDGGLFVLRTSGIPAPIVSVWVGKVPDEAKNGAGG